MYEATCIHCSTVATITPDDAVCPGCGEDLQHLLPVDVVVDYFRARVHEYWISEDTIAALAETERGLTFVESSDLHLLAAILAKRLGRHDLMRRHVAAIPVDDSLRGEAEWLLRSHQNRERALQEAALAQASPRDLPTTPTSTFLDELTGHTHDVAPPVRSPWATVISIAIVSVAGMLIVASWWWFGPGAIPTPPDQGVAGMIPTPEPSPVLAPSTPANDADPAAILPTPTSTPVMQTSPLSTSPETPGVADNSARPVVLVTVTPFDLEDFLRSAEQDDLTDLPITARIQDERLILQGIVYLDAQRRRLIRILQTVPGVLEVDAVELLVRPLPTYVVQPGDTLWSIVFSIYGDVDRLDEFAAFNRDILISPDSLLPGVELKVMPPR